MQTGQPVAPAAETRMVFEPRPTRRHETHNRKEFFPQKTNGRQIDLTPLNTLA
jgi:hypothetical protein